jgi:hypothetical protein
MTDWLTYHALCGSFLKDWEWHEEITENIKNSRRLIHRRGLLSIDDYRMLNIGIEERTTSL